jgi:mono/diheme cytochrome c family protein
MCHDRVGTGNGKVVQRGYLKPPSYHSERLRAMRVGHIFQVITRGQGGMPAFYDQITPRDRWAIVAYVRALQLSQNFPRKDLTEADRAQWRKDESAAGTAKKENQE